VLFLHKMNDLEIYGIYEIYCEASVLYFPWILYVWKKIWKWMDELFCWFKYFTTCMLNFLFFFYVKLKIYSIIWFMKCTARLVINFSMHFVCMKKKWKQMDEPFGWFKCFRTCTCKFKKNCKCRSFEMPWLLN